MMGILDALHCSVSHTLANLSWMTFFLPRPSLVNTRTSYYRGKSSQKRLRKPSWSPGRASCRVSNRTRNPKSGYPIKLIQVSFGFVITAELASQSINWAAGIPWLACSSSFTLASSLRKATPACHDARHELWNWMLNWQTPKTLKFASAAAK